MAFHRRFADASESATEARYVILGVPFDSTTSYRPGARFAPAKIREASWNFEMWNHMADVDMSQVKVADLGDIDDHRDPDEMLDDLSSEILPHVQASRVPIVLGGEHSLAGGVARAVKPDFYVAVDAHLDYRDEFHGSKNSHACSLRRVADIAGSGNVLALGIRSIARDEFDDARRDGVAWLSPEECEGARLETLLSKALAAERVYLSIDIDGIDPAFAPGTGTPEPYGLHPLFVRDLVKALAPKVVAFDVNEVCPPFDNGNTSVLAARLVRDFLAWSHKARGAK